MKIKEELNLEVLLDYGFTKIDKEQAKENEDWMISCYEYIFEIGHARRGEFYYLLVSETQRDIIIYASEHFRKNCLVLWSYINQGYCS